MNKKLPERKRRRLAERYAAGEPSTKLAKEYGVSAEYCRRAAAEFGLDRDPTVRVENIRKGMKRRIRRGFVPFNVGAWKRDHDKRRKHVKSNRQSVAHSTRRRNRSRTTTHRNTAHR